MRTFGDILDANKGIAPGFDFVRVFLALSVLAIHVPETVLGLSGQSDRPVLWIFSKTVLPMFFGLSGFLVAASAQRLSLRNFAINRGFRIFPALVVEIMLSAFLIGPALTIIPIRQYFLDSQFAAYLLNMVGIIHYRLPGVFEANPTPFIVNGSLWTVPHEILCYLVMAVLIVTGLSKRPTALAIAAFVALSFNTLLQYGLEPILASERSLRLYEVYYHSALGPLLLPSFLVGAVAYNWRNRIVFSWWLLALSVGTLFAVGAVLSADTWKIPPLAFLICPAMIYIVCFVGMLDIPPLPIFARGDYSYGIYLYGYPIQQTLVLQFPAVTSLTAQFLMAACAATMFAACSWHLIEKPILGLRKGLSFSNRVHSASATL